MTISCIETEPHSMMQPSEKMNPLLVFESSVATTNLGGSRLVEQALNDLLCQYKHHSIHKLYDSLGRHSINYLKYLSRFQNNLFHIA